MRTAAASLALILAACAGTPEPVRDPERFVVAVGTEDGTRVETAGAGAYVPALDPWHVARLARAVLPGVAVEDVEGGVGLTVDSRASARAIVMAARWTDGIIRARDALEARGDVPPRTDAAIIAATIRAWLRPDAARTPPDWAALSAALERRPVFEVAPVHAGMGSIVYAGMILRGPAGEPARDRAARLLSRATALRNVPDWLSWLAYSAWSRRDFFARDDRPSSP